MDEIEFWKIETVQKDGKRFSEQYAGRKSEAIERVKFNLRLRFVDYCILFKKTETRMRGEKHKGYEQVGRYVYSDFVVKPPEWLLDCIPKETNDGK